MDNLYADALSAAYRELNDLGEQERAIAIRKAQLRQTVNALYPLVFPDAVDINSLSLPDAMRLVLRSAGRPLSAHDFKTKLEDMGFDLSKHDNPLANILTAMNRMVDADEMVWVKGAAKKTAAAGPELKSVPEAPQFPPSGLSTVLPFLTGIPFGTAPAPTDTHLPSSGRKTLGQRIAEADIGPVTGESLEDKK